MLAQALSAIEWSTTSSCLRYRYSHKRTWIHHLYGARTFTFGCAHSRVLFLLVKQFTPAGAPLELASRMHLLYWSIGERDGEEKGSGLSGILLLVTVGWTRFPDEKQKPGFLRCFLPGGPPSPLDPPAWWGRVLLLLLQLLLPLLLLATAARFRSKPRV